jgi:hypothetical protein
MLLSHLLSSGPRQQLSMRCPRGTSKGRISARPRAATWRTRPVPVSQTSLGQFGPWASEGPEGVVFPEIPGGPTIR